ncbi:NlpC/P60 family protein [Flavobacterium sp.]|uniref:NlpC/P60 family protein n=1 Tax=Flavobacterium sp. TaxID=239 RepID=UPI002B4B237E|nr:NlpC/P60 family protein [Flavobacterium sp.]HLF52735.1 NlpC/P60 family protein [Flavobacterium sp.]
MIKRFALIAALVFFTSINVFSQEKHTKHTIVKGETITKIAQDYNVKPEDIYKLNPNAKKLLKLNSILLIPTVQSKKINKVVQTKTPVPATNSPAIVHEILPKETLYGISRQYGITIKELNEANPALGSNALKIGQKINIPGNASATTEKAVVIQPKKELPVIETAVVVQPKKELPIIETAVITQPKKVTPTAEIPVMTEQNTTVNTISKAIVHEVLPKETKYSLAKRYGITVAELEKQNPEVKKTLPVGFKLNINNPNLTNEVVATVNNDTKSENKEINFPEKTFFNSDMVDQLIRNASENIGTRYHTGGTSKAGFDCSGLMCNTFGAFDIKLPRTSFEQSSYGTKINTEEAKKGDLIFFKTNGRGQINHVGMVVEVVEGEIKFIHASVQRGVIISSTKENYYKKNFIQVNRIVL